MPDKNLEALTWLTRVMPDMVRGCMELMEEGSVGWMQKLFSGDKSTLLQFALISEITWIVLFPKNGKIKRHRSSFGSRV